VQASFPLLRQGLSKLCLTLSKPCLTLEPSLSAHDREHLMYFKIAEKKSKIQKILEFEANPVLNPRLIKPNTT
jgi:hypothetical protein